MRKCRFTLAGITESNVLSDPLSLLSELDKHQIGIPDYALFCMAISRPSKGLITVLFFEESNDYLTHYTKNVVLKRKPNSKIFCFNRQADGLVWLRHSPPTLIGLNLETRLRD